MLLGNINKMALFPNCFLKQYPDYGVLEGRVKRIAQDVIQSQNNSSNSNSRSARQQTPNFYEVFVSPEASTFGRKEYQCSLQPGMEGSAEIITREETVLRFILRKARLSSNIYR